MSHSLADNLEHPDVSKEPVVFYFHVTEKLESHEKEKCLFLQNI
jgi:hypothetical protein